MTKSILFPTNFSSHSINATLFAVEIAKLADAKLNLLHVYDVHYSAINIQDQDDPSGDTMKDNRANSREQLKRIIDENKLPQHPHKTYVREGDLFGAIEEVTKIEGIDLVVVGQQDKIRTNTLFGGDSIKIINTSTCPVLTVPFDSEYNSFSHITYLTDLNSKEDDELKQLERFTTLFGARITVLHIGEEPIFGADVNTNLLSDISN